MTRRIEMRRTSSLPRRLKRRPRPRGRSYLRRSTERQTAKDIRKHQACTEEGRCKGGGEERRRTAMGEPASVPVAPCAAAKVAHIEQDDYDDDDDELFLLSHLVNGNDIHAVSLLV
jgi:hypothetical protein